MQGYPEAYLKSSSVWTPARTTSKVFKQWLSMAFYRRYSSAQRGNYWGKGKQQKHVYHYHVG